MLQNKYVTITFSLFMTAQFLFITAQIGYHCTLELGMV